MTDDASVERAGHPIGDTLRLARSTGPGAVVGALCSIGISVMYAMILVAFGDPTSAVSLLTNAYENMEVLDDG